MKLLIFILFVILGAEISQAQTYNCTVFNQTDYAATTVSTRILAASPYRRCLSIQNNGGNTAYVKFTSAHSNFEGTRILTTATYAPIVIPVNAVYLKAVNGSTTTVTVIEGK